MTTASHNCQITFQWQIFLGNIYEAHAKVAFLKPLAQWYFLISKQVGLLSELVESVLEFI